MTNEEQDEALAPRIPDAEEENAAIDRLAQFECLKCQRSFKSDRALRMHKIRKHSSRNWDTSQNFKHKGSGAWSRKQPVAQRLARRREYQRRLRDRYYREGRNSKGELMSAGWKPRKWGARRLQAAALRKRTGRWADPEFRRQYQRDMYAKIKAQEAVNNQHQPAEAPSSASPIQPDITGEAARAIMVAASVLRAVTTGMKITNT